MRKKIHETAVIAETAVLVALVNQKQNEISVKEYLDELEFLAETAGIKTLKRFTQRLERPETRTFVGKGKLEEINTYVKTFDVKIVIFDDELSPSQLRNLENELKVKIYDRSLLILDIFLLRAKSAQAKTQVELARFQYLLPRLTRMWTHLERQRGGTGTRGGSGELQIETDRRLIREEIAFLKEKLTKIDKQSLTQRKNRGQLARVALVGYTNVGKSTIMNILSKADVFAENKLFATVDTTVRKVTLSNLPFLLSDTVGFIRKLPHSLIECFKSTLDEVRECDILIHVVDISNPSFENHIEIVSETLKEIKAVDKKVILVFNKIDLYREKMRALMPDEDIDLSIEQLEKTYMAKLNTPSLFISALEKEGINKLRKTIFDEVLKVHLTIFPNYLHIE
jgi:GTPase